MSAECHGVLFSGSQSHDRSISCYLSLCMIVFVWMFSCVQMCMCALDVPHQRHDSWLKNDLVLCLSLCVCLFVCVCVCVCVCTYIHMRGVLTYIGTMFSCSSYICVARVAYVCTNFCKTNCIFISILVALINFLVYDSLLFIDVYRVFGVLVHTYWRWNKINLILCIHIPMFQMRRFKFVSEVLHFLCHTHTSRETLINRVTWPVHEIFQCWEKKKQHTDDQSCSCVLLWGEASCSWANNINQCDLVSMFLYRDIFAHEWSYCSKEELCPLPVGAQLFDCDSSLFGFFSKYPIFFLPRSLGGAGAPPKVETMASTKRRGYLGTWQLQWQRAYTVAYIASLLHLCCTSWRQRDQIGALYCQRTVRTGSAEPGNPSDQAVHSTIDLTK